MSRNARKRIFGQVYPAKIQIILSTHAVRSESSLGAFQKSKYAMFLHADNAQRAHDVYTTSTQRHDIASTLRRRCINVMCPLCEDWDQTDGFSSVWRKCQRVRFFTVWHTRLLKGITWFPYMPIHINVHLANTLDATEFKIVLQELSLIKLRYLYKNVAVMSEGDFPKMFI